MFRGDQAPAPTMAEVHPPNAIGTVGPQPTSRSSAATIPSSDESRGSKARRSEADSGNHLTARLSTIGLALVVRLSPPRKQRSQTGCWRAPLRRRRLCARRRRSAALHRSERITPCFFPSRANRVLRWGWNQPRKRSRNRQKVTKRTKCERGGFGGSGPRHSPRR